MAGSSSFVEDNFSNLVIAGVIVYLLGWAFYKVVFRYRYTSKFRHFPGPKRSSLIYGNMPDLFESNPPFVAFNEWRKRFGRVVRFCNPLGVDALLITDPAAMKHILLDHAYEYPKSTRARLTLTLVAGSGILVAEGDVHKKQKRLLAPAFSAPHVTSLTPVFIQKSQDLAEIFNKSLGNKKSGEFNVLEWMDRLALDLVGAAGFGHEFNSMYNDDNPLAIAFKTLFTVEPAPSYKTLFSRSLLLRIPLLQKLPVKRIKTANWCMAQMEKQSAKIIAERKEEIRSEAFHGKDLITVLLKANAQADAKSKLTDDEVTGQITTFLIAGSETTSTAAAWTFYYLAKYPEVQEKLRKELLDAKQDGTFAPDVLNNLSYLDAVVREISRIMPSVVATEREALYDDVIPLSKPVTLTNGKQITELEIKAGQFFSVAISELNHREELFGEDVDVFRPERWLEPLPDALTSQTAGYTAWSNMMTFIGGPRACIGRHFAVAEMKSVIAVMIANFKFEECDRKPEIIWRVDVTSPPFVKGEEGDGKKLPMKISRL